mgnify:CR=1 FL=1
MADASVFTRFRRRLHPGVAPVLVGAVGLAGATLLHFVDPNEPGHYPTCPWLMITGTFCPGCGTTRGLYALTHLDILGALQLNVLLVAMAPYLAYSYLKWLYRSFRPAPPRATPRKAVDPRWLYLLVAVIMGFWVVRNLPFASFLAPG